MAHKQPSAGSVPVPAASSAPTTAINPSTPAPSASIQPDSSVWDRLSSWASENKAVVYTLATVTVIATGAGIYYISNSSSSSSTKGRRRQNTGKSASSSSSQQKSKKSVPSGPPADLPKVTEEYVQTLSPQERADLSVKLKVAGNSAYAAKNFNVALDYYAKALMCKKDPIFYSNRAACYNELSDWENVIKEATSALELDRRYQKALNRRAVAHHKLNHLQDALVDYTTLCLLDQFTNENTSTLVEKLLKEISTAEAKKIMEAKKKSLPSPTFVSNYLKSFRPRPLPPALEESAELEENSGLDYLRKGLLALERRIGDEYAVAANAFEKAIDKGNLGEHEAFAYNMRGTFRYLKGDTAAALEDMTKSIELDPKLTQSYVKRSTLHLEQTNRELAFKDFDNAIAQNPNDPDIYYHRAQLNFVLTQYEDAMKDYKKSIELDDTFVYSHIQLGVTQYRSDDKAGSDATFQKCLKRFATIPEVHNYYGELLLDQEKFPEALRQFDEAIALEQKNNPTSMNVLPLINKALAIFISHHGSNPGKEAQDLCKRALIIDPGCDIAHATWAQLCLQQNQIEEALKHFESAAMLCRTELEMANAISYAQATRAQLEVQKRYPEFASPIGAGGPPS